MQTTLIGEHPLAKDEKGNQKNFVGEYFYTYNALMFSAGIHATLINYFIDLKRKEKEEQGERFTEEDKNKIFDYQVKLNVRRDSVFIRPKKDNIQLMFDADCALREILPKKQIFFTQISDPDVKEAIKDKGMLYRIAQIPRTIEEQINLINDSFVALSDRAMYNHNMESGERVITYHVFEELESLPHPQKAKYLDEILQHLIKGDQKKRELKFFMAYELDLNEYMLQDVTTMSEYDLNKMFEDMKQKLKKSIKKEFRRDHYLDPVYRGAMLDFLIGETEQETTKVTKISVCPEIEKNTKWVAGAERLPNGEIVFDDCYEKECPDEESDLEEKDEKVMDIILNIVVENGRRMSNSPNIGIIEESLSMRYEETDGRREVYQALFKTKNKSTEGEVIVKEERKIIRMLPHAASDILKEERAKGNEINVFAAALRAQQQLIQLRDKYAASEELGMNVAPFRIAEIYEIIEGEEVPLPYLERDYIPGYATNKIPISKYEIPGYQDRLAVLLAKAYAANWMCGRTTKQGNPFIDSGDEIVTENRHGFPHDIFFLDISRSFSDYSTPLVEFTEAYVMPVVSREPHLKNRAAFYRFYASRIEKQIDKTKKEFLKREKPFKLILKGRKFSEEEETLAYRYFKCLDRLKNTDPKKVRATMNKFAKKLGFLDKYTGN